jgi:hypothetical protein
MDKPARSLSRAAGVVVPGDRAVGDRGLEVLVLLAAVLTRQRAVAQLQALGYRVTLEPLAA